MSDQSRNSTSVILLPRSVRDGSLAAAIGVALALAQESDHFEVQTHDAPIETPWARSSHIQMIHRRSGFQIQNKWGDLAGWKAGHGRWGTIR